jgi:hypothetical protein
MLLAGTLCPRKPPEFAPLMLSGMDKARYWGLDIKLNRRGLRAAGTYPPSGLRPHARILTAWDYRIREARVVRCTGESAKAGDMI